MGHQVQVAGGTDGHAGGGAAALVVRAADAEEVPLPHAGAFRLLTDGGAAGVNRLSLGAGSAGAPEHFHTRSTELFYVLGGAADFVLGTERVRVAEGGLVLVPPGLTHAFGAAPGTGAELLVVLTPGWSASATSGRWGASSTGWRRSRNCCPTRTATTSTSPGRRSGVTRPSPPDLPDKATRV